jgi:hypothetical protein
MQIGSAQTQSLIASINVSSKVGARAVSSQKDGPVDAVLMSVGGSVDTNYAQQVLATELGQSFANAMRDAGIEGQALDDVLSGVIDFSPEATAKRIVDFASSFFGSFQANNADQDGNSQIDGFSELIRGAIEKGFAQAKDILEGIAKISAGVAAYMDETFVLVMKGIDDFAEGKRGVLAAAADAPPDSQIEQPEDLLVI